VEEEEEEEEDFEANSSSPDTPPLSSLNPVPSSSPLIPEACKIYLMMRMATTKKKKMEIMSKKMQNGYA
jgi:hypothetical protein